jgi:hypothetical protein
MRLHWKENEGGEEGQPPSVHETPETSTTEVWHVTFLEPGPERPLPKKLTFKDEGKIRELTRRGEAWQTSEDRQMLDYAIAKGEGGVYLRLSPEQYARLRRP